MSFMDIFYMTKI